MTARKYTYAVEVEDEAGRWHPISLDMGESKDFCLGYAWGRQSSPSPRLACRVVRSDGRIEEHFEANPEVGIGMIAGFPTAKQYRDAAARALKRAEMIEAQDRRREERRRG